MTIPASPLFTPLKVGDITLAHRVAMAPLTRFRALPSHEHDVELATTYYSQRASTPGTLLISEATFISPRASGYHNIPGIWTTPQAIAWRTIVSAVHSKCSFLFLQLWALGRTAKPEILEADGGGQLCSASDIPLTGRQTPTPLTKERMDAFVKDYADAAKRFVVDAGGDGVEVHMANGYLLDQFLQSVSNKRTDEYGGNVENRIRFPLEVVQAVVSAVGEKKVGVRVSPFGTFQDMKMPLEELKETFGTLASELKLRFPQLAYLHAVDARAAGNPDETTKPAKGESLDFLREIWYPKPFLFCGSLSPKRALDVAAEMENTVAVFGRAFLANPDLPERIRRGIEPNEHNRETFYTPGAMGYTDYSFAT
ncbi:FMN-linked oxidoreductase [Meredithblackwellia eburnea MCA 4105]